MPRMIKNGGYTTPTKEEMRIAIEEAKLRKKDFLLNGEDKIKDDKKEIDKINQEITKGFELYIDNLKELLKFLDEFNVSDTFAFHCDKKDKIVRYNFGFYEVMGNSYKENEDMFFNKHNPFLIAYSIPKSDIMFKNANLDYLMKPVLNSHPLRDKISAYEFAVYTKAKRLQELYQQIVDNRYFIPEFIIKLPKQYLTEYFFMHLVNCDLCDGLYTYDKVPKEIHKRLQLPYYPIIFIDPSVGQYTRDKVKASLKFLNDHNEYML